MKRIEAVELWVLALLLSLGGCQAGTDNVEDDGPRICVYDWSHYELTTAPYYRDESHSGWRRRCSDRECHWLEREDFGCSSDWGQTRCEGDYVDYRVEYYGTCEEREAGIDLDMTEWRDERAGWSVSYSEEPNNGEWYYEVAGDQPRRAEACQDFLDCYIPCDPEGPDSEECWRCFDETRDDSIGLTAASDLVVCAWYDCPSTCGPGAGAACRDCLEDRCRRPAAACNSGDAAYENPWDGDLFRCFDIIRCEAGCLERRPDDESCFHECYWDGGAGARVDVVRYIFTFGMSQPHCARECLDPSSDACWSCFARWTRLMGIESCFDEGFFEDL